MDGFELISAWKETLTFDTITCYLQLIETLKTSSYICVHVFLWRQHMLCTPLRCTTYRRLGETTGIVIQIQLTYTHQQCLRKHHSDSDSDNIPTAHSAHSHSITTTHGPVKWVPTCIKRTRTPKAQTPILEPMKCIAIKYYFGNRLRIRILWNHCDTV